MASWPRPSTLTSLDEDPFSDPVDLDDIRKAAEDMACASDGNWH